MRVVIAFLLWIACVAEVWAEEDMRKQYLNALWTNCSTIGALVIYEPAKHALIPSLTEDSMEVLIHSRLRTAHLYQDWDLSKPYLYLFIEPMKDEPGDNLTELALISLDFRKRMYDPWTKTSRQTVVWEYQTWAGRTRLYEQVSGLMDIFINAYLQVNEPACQRK